MGGNKAVDGTVSVSQELEEPDNGGCMSSPAVGIKRVAFGIVSRDGVIRDVEQVQNTGNHDASSVPSGGAGHEKRSGGGAGDLENECSERGEAVLEHFKIAEGSGLRTLIGRRDPVLSDGFKEGKVEDLDAWRDGIESCVGQFCSGSDVKDALQVEGGECVLLVGGEPGRCATAKEALSGHDEIPPPRGKSAEIA
jgi:hypothetical protein